MANPSVHQVTFRAHAKQLAFLRSHAHLVALVGGAGSGKTTAGVIWSLLRAVTWRGSRGMMIARSYPQLKQSLLVELEAWAREARLDRHWRFNRQDMEVQLPNGSRFWLRSADRPESLLGADLAWVYGDEVALWDENAFKYALSRLRQPGFQHQAAFTFTPKGRNWAFDVFGRRGPDVEAIRCSTRENPHLDPSFVRMLEAQYGDTPFARQEIDGEFVSFEGLVYPQFNELAHVRPLSQHTSITRVVAGVDWGYTSPGAVVVLAALAHPAATDADATLTLSQGLAASGALSGQEVWGYPSCWPRDGRAPRAARTSRAGSRVAASGALSGEGVWGNPSWQPKEGFPQGSSSSQVEEGFPQGGSLLWAVDEVYARQVPPVGPGECWVSIARRLQERWGIEAFYCDPSEPANIAALAREGLPAAAGDNSVEPGVARVAALLSAGRLLVSPSCRNLIEEFTRYAYEVDRDGRATGRVVKAFDHALDALRYAVVGLQSRPTPRTFVQSA